MPLTQTAIVTGAGQGLGAALARKLASRGINVLVADLNETTGPQVAQELKGQFGVDAFFVRTDVSNEDDVKAMVKAAVDRWGRLDYACNNAAIGEVITFTEKDYSVQNFDRMYSVLPRAAWLCQKYECEQMLKQPPRQVQLGPSSKTVPSRGSVVNIASVAGLVGMGQPGYAAAKAAVQSVTRTGSQFYGSSHIRINTVSPGAIMSDGFHKWLPTLEVRAKEFVENNIISGPPAKRMGQPEELAATVSWLLSDESTFMHASNVICDGGYYNTRYAAEPAPEGNLVGI
ncbi:hypothetical protein LTS17_005623 [Exophiala oligosperma]